MNPTLPTGSQERKDIPMVRGLLDYFPAALAAVAEGSRVGNDKHNPGEEMHHARGKSMDHADCILRHLVDRGDTDDTGVRHSTWIAWRALAMLQQELEDAGEAPLARGARLPDDAEATQEKVAQRYEELVPAAVRKLEGANTPIDLGDVTDALPPLQTDPHGVQYYVISEDDRPQTGQCYVDEEDGTVREFVGIDGTVIFAGKPYERCIANFRAPVVSVVSEQEKVAGIPEGVLPCGWTIDSVHHFERVGSPADRHKGWWRIVDYRVPEPGDKYVYLETDCQSGTPEVLTAGRLKTRPRLDLRPIVEPAEDPEILTDAFGARYRILVPERLIQRGDCWLSPQNYVCGPWVGADATHVKRTIVERVG